MSSRTGRWVGAIVLVLCAAAAALALDLPLPAWTAPGKTIVVSTVPAPTSAQTARSKGASRIRGKIREISPEEAERLMEQIRNRTEIPLGR